MVEISRNDLKYEDLMFDGWRQVEKTITFDGGTLNGIGDADGTSNPFTIFNVTGEVKAKVIGICTTNLAGDTATVEVGTSVDTDAIVAQTTATDIDAGEIWHDASPNSDIEAESVMSEKILANGTNIIGTVATADVTAGVIKFICLWRPLSKNGNVTAA